MFEAYIRTVIQKHYYSWLFDSMCKLQETPILTEYDLVDEKFNIPDSFDVNARVACWRSCIPDDLMIDYDDTLGSNSNGGWPTSGNFVINHQSVDDNGSVDTAVENVDKAQLERLEALAKENLSKGQHAEKRESLQGYLKEYTFVLNYKPNASADDRKTINQIKRKYEALPRPPSSGNGLSERSSDLNIAGNLAARIKAYGGSLLKLHGVSLETKNGRPNKITVMRSWSENECKFFNACIGRLVKEAKEDKKTCKAEVASCIQVSIQKDRSNSVFFRRVQC